MSASEQAETRIIAPDTGGDTAATRDTRRSLRMRLWDQTSVKQNLSSNLVTKGLSALVSLACVPIYLRVLGVSGYGLIGVRCCRLRSICSVQAGPRHRDWRAGWQQRSLVRWYCRSRPCRLSDQREKPGLGRR